MSDDPQRVMYMWLFKREKEKSRLKKKIFRGVAGRKLFFFVGVP